jgi:hypothetical protein
MTMTWNLKRGLGCRKGELRPKHLRERRHELLPKRLLEHSPEHHLNPERPVK